MSETINRVSFGISTPKPRAEALENLDTAGMDGTDHGQVCSELILSS